MKKTCPVPERKAEGTVLFAENYSLSLPFIGTFSECEGKITRQKRIKSVGKLTDFFLFIISFLA